MAAARVAALVMAAGHGARYGGALPKQYQPLLGRTPIARVLDAFADHPAIGQLCCVIDPGMADTFAAAAGARHNVLIVHGGPTRQDSVRNGLEALAALPEPPDLALIHDAARPLLPPSAIDGVLACLAEADAAAPALPIADTLSGRDDIGFGAEVDRATLLQRQTPQGFRFAAILAAHRRFAGADAHGPATDDIALARRAGLRTMAAPGSMLLHKLTTPDDKIMLEAFLGSHGRSSVGNGFDVHAFGPGGEVILCGLAIPHDQGLVGHSDADVAMHALTDAMLGAVGAGDIGQLFPPSDPQWKGAASRIFLERALQEIRSRGAELESVDVTIICEAPKIGPHRDAMRARLAELLDLAPDRVNVKATTTEGLGFTGRREGIAAMATATVWRCL